MEFFLLVALMAVALVMSVPWALAYSRAQQSAARWPRKIVTSHSATSAGGGAYRAGDVAVERVVSVEEGPPAAVAKSGRAAFTTASAMFVGGVMAGAWLPVGLWLRAKSQLDLSMSAAYALGLSVCFAWLFAAFLQFRAAWDRWDPALLEARSTASDAWSASVFAAGVSVLAVLAARVVYGVDAPMAPLWFALFVLGRAWLSRRSVEANAPLYLAAEANELARSARESTGVRVASSGTRERADEREEELAGASAMPMAGAGSSRR